MAPVRAEGIEIRPAAETDREDLARLCQELGYAATGAEIAERCRSVNGNCDHAIWVAVRGQILIGWVEVALVRHLVSGVRAELLGLVVATAARRQGVGQLLVAAAEKWARDRGLPTISLVTNVVRTEAHEFYRALGYRETKTQLSFRKNL